MHMPRKEAPAAPPEATVTLAFADRHRRRIRLTDDRGRDFLLDLPRAVRMEDGDRLLLDDGDALEVRAAPEAVMEMRPESPQEAARLAWHLGNRHAPVQILPDGRIRALEDHVLFAMLEHLGARPARLSAPFSPESGAYGGNGHSRDHGRDQGRGHEH
jgi:urease accessory protein